MPGSTRVSATGETPRALEPPRIGVGWRWWARRFVRNKVAPIGLVIIAASLLVAVLAPVIIPHDIRAMAPQSALTPQGRA